MYILAGKRRLEKALMRSSLLSGQGAKTGLPEDAQAANDFANMCFQI
jgi:hypothetical protein